MDHGVRNGISLGDNRPKSIFTPIKDVIFHSFDLINFESRTSFGFAYSSIAIQVLQLFFLTYECENDFEVPNEYIGYVVSMILEPLSFGYLNSGNQSTLIIGFIASLFFVALATSLIIQLARSNTDSSKRNRQAETTYTSLELLQTIFLVPGIGYLYQFSECDATIGLCTHSVLKPILMLISMSAIAVWVVLALLTSMFLGAHSPFDNDGKLLQTQVITLSNRPFFIQTGIRLFLTIFLRYWDFANNMNLTLTSVIVWLVGSLLMMAVSWYYCPYVHMKLNLFAMAAYTLLFWRTIALAIHYAVGSTTDHSAQVYFWVASPFVIIAAVSTLTRRIKRLTREIPLNQITFGAHVYLLRLCQLYMVSMPRLSISGQFEAECKRALHLNPNSAFLMIHVAEVFKNGKRILFGLQLMQACRQLPYLAVDTEFELYCLSKRHSLDSDEDCGGLRTFMKYDSMKKTVEILMGQILRETRALWKTLMDRQYTVHGLMQSGINIYTQSEKCGDEIQKMMKAFPMDRDVLELHALYLDLIKHDSIASAAVRDRILTMHAQVESRAVVIVSGNRKDLGRIIDTTDDLAKMFGYTKEGLIGEHMNSLCPAPFDRVHDSMLETFLSRDVEFETKTRFIFGLSSEGFVFPVEFLITPSTNETNDIIFLGKFTDISDDNKHIFLVDADSYQVTTYSKRVPEIFNLDSAFVETYSVTDLLPDFFDDGNSKSSKYLDIPGVKSTEINEVPVHVLARKLVFTQPPGSIIEYKLGVILLSVEIDTMRMNTRQGDNFLSTTLVSQSSFLLGENDSEGSSSMLFAGGSRRRLEGGFESSSSFHRNTLLVPSSSAASIDEADESAGGNDTTDNNQIMVEIKQNILSKSSSTKSFRRVVQLFCVAFFIAMFIGVEIWSVSLSKVEVTAGSLVDVHMELQQLARIGKNMDMQRNPITVVNGSDYEGSIITNMTNDVLQRVTKVRATHDRVVVATSGYYGSSVYTAMFEPSLDALDAGYRPKTLSLHLAIMGLFSFMQHYVSVDMEACERAYFYVVNNIMFSGLMEQGFVAGSFYEEMFTVGINGAFEYGWIITTIVCLLSVLYLVYFLMPMVVISFERMERFDKSFTSIRYNILRRLYNQYNQQIRLLENRHDDNEDNSGVVMDALEKTELEQRKFSSKRKTKKIAKHFMHLQLSIWLVMKVGLCLWIAIGATCMYQFMAPNVTVSILSSARILIAACRRNSYIEFAGFWTTNFPQNVSGLDSSYANLTTEFESYYEKAVEYFNAINLGSAEMNIERGFSITQGDLFTLYFEDQCGSLCDQNLSSLYEWDRSVLSDLEKGSFFAMNNYLRDIGKIVTANRLYQSTGNIDDYNSYLELKSNFRSVYGANTLLDSFADTLLMHQTDLNQVIDDFLANAWVLVVLLFFLLVIGYILTIRSIQKFDKEYKDAQTLLLAIPVDVIVTNQDLLALAHTH